MAREKWTGRIDGLLVRLVKRYAADQERSEAFIVETCLREMFKDELPPGWRPGQSEDIDDTGTT